MYLNIEFKKDMVYFNKGNRCVFIRHNRTIKWPEIQK